MAPLAEKKDGIVMLEMNMHHSHGAGRLIGTLCSWRGWSAPSPGSSRSSSPYTHRTQQTWDKEKERRRQRADEKIALDFFVFFLAVIVAHGG